MAQILGIGTDTKQPWFIHYQQIFGRLNCFIHLPLPADSAYSRAHKALARATLTLPGDSMIPVQCPSV